MARPSNTSRMLEGYRAAVAAAFPETSDIDRPESVHDAIEALDTLHTMAYSAESLDIGEASKWLTEIRVAATRVFNEAMSALAMEAA